MHFKKNSTESFWLDVDVDLDLAKCRVHPYPVKFKSSPPWQALSAVLTLRSIKCTGLIGKEKRISSALPPPVPLLRARLSVAFFLEGWGQCTRGDGGERRRVTHQRPRTRTRRNTARVKKADEKTNTALCSGSAEVLIRERSEARGRREPPAVAAPSDALSRDLGHRGNRRVSVSRVTARKPRCGRGCDGGTATANDLLLIGSSGLGGHLLEMACGGTSLEAFEKRSWRIRRCRCTPPSPAELCERFSLWWSREAIFLSRRLKIVKSPWEKDEKEEFLIHHS